MKIEIGTLPKSVAQLIEQAQDEPLELTDGGKVVATLLVHDNDHDHAFTRALEIVKVEGNDLHATRQLRQEFPISLREARDLILRAKKQPVRRS